MAELEYRVSVDTKTGIASLKKLDNQIDKTNKSAQSLNTRLKSLNEGFDSFRRTVGYASVAAAGIVVGMAKATGAALDYADAIGKASDVAGVATDSLQEFRYAFGLFNISAKETDDSFRRLNRRLGEFVKSGGGPAKQAFDQLGLSADIMSGNLKGTEAVMDELVDRLGRIEDDAIRAALASQLFGDDAGPKLALALAQGAQAIDSLRQKARDLGLIMDEDLIRASEEANDTISTLTQVIGVQFKSALVESAPQITEFVQALIEHRDDIKGMIALVVELSNALLSAGSAVVEFAQDAGLISRSIDQQIKEVEEALAGEESRLRFFGPKGVIEYYTDEELQIELARLKKLKAASDATNEALKEQAEERKKSYSNEPFELIGGPDASAINEVTAAYLPLKKAQQDYAVELEKINKIAISENFTLADKEMALENLRNKYYENIRGLAGVNEARREAEETAKKLKAAEEELTRQISATVDEYLPLKRLTRELKSDQTDLNAALAKGLITQEEHAAAMDVLNKKYKDFYKEQRDKSREWSDGWNRALDEYVDNATNAAEQAESVFRTATQGMEDAIVGFAKTGKFEWKSFLSSIVDDLLRSQARQLIANVFGGLGGQTGGNGGGIFAGFFANGGVIPSGQVGIVGEAGPELVSGPAQVTPLASGGNVTYNINAVDAQSFKQLVARDPQFIYAVTEEGRRGLPSRR